ncbi:hypothetical protein METBIDRAFT_79649 [Metschnikowia bicuspidata var. bicuspidata NRRL YB-4993]|uniref:Nucleoside phosphatase GDA1/CD39 n=1 Tax=Metschnikowia bicuspidata var. bicuspidata NRRL YB-4993 TaxID=869754 RepID=A0A1A0H6W5_9ASCO|nr:hypothetical protein METBIDRAFT_79649 [Metschnikowia bicuspidata var. bicuspidata NRRL YB-4993]OBA19652.1 hypothetical protein METBIDRAFT_79649 [Metschnikowia bicuspidata var. bicuspidata NRRL YB-4993]
MSPKLKRKSKAHRKISPGPILSPEGIPYDYIVVIDAGSHGSRVHVYNWLNPHHALNAGTNIGGAARVNLVRRLFADEGERSRLLTDEDSDSESDTERENDNKRKTVRFPFVHKGKKWHRSIKPGLSSFNQSPQKVGKHHLNYLLNLAGSVVPKSEHYRTPIFVHATAGMRLLPPNEQEPILENVCQYLIQSSDFFMPDCKSHVNIVDGNIEGLYGWLSINSLVGSFDWPEEHQHGKDHTTYGLLDMGGASTQVVFQPNKTEIEEHNNNLYKVSLYTLPQLQNVTEPVDAISNNQYAPPELTESSVYSDSFLGFGMFQAHHRYLKLLLEDFRKENDFPEDAYRFRTPISDPCLPKGYTFTGLIDDHYIDFTGRSDFQECMNSIFPVLANNTYTLGKSKYSGNCQQLGEESKVSSCLLSDMIPSFDFDINHFIGVSGYWDIVNSLLTSQSLLNEDSQTEKYDYSVIYKKTQQICYSPLTDLLEMNSIRDPKAKIKEEDLAELCFKASWILNFLHVGLGFPRFGINEIPNKNDKFKSLQLMDKLGGSSFSWTLGRAILYANDEYTQAFNNYSKRLDSLAVELPRPGYVFTAAEGTFIYGAEAEHVSKRPMYSEAPADAKYPQYDYETYNKEPHELKWTVQPHRIYGLGRLLLRERLASKYGSAKAKIARLFGRGQNTYGRLNDTEPIEMTLVQAQNLGNRDVFRIEEEMT